MTNNELLTVNEVATILKTSKRAMQNMIAARKTQKLPIPLIRLNGKQVRFSRVAVEQWLEQKMQEEPR